MRHDRTQQPAPSPEVTALSQPRSGQTDTAGKPDLRIDALGEKCPVPIIMLAQRIGEVAVGHVVQVLADDPAAKSDVPAWCGLKSHDFLGMTELAGVPGWSFLVRRGY